MEIKIKPNITVTLIPSLSKIPEYCNKHNCNKILIEVLDDETNLLGYAKFCPECVPYEPTKLSLV